MTTSQEVQARLDRNLAKFRLLPLGHDESGELFQAELFIEILTRLEALESGETQRDHERRNGSR